MRCTDRLDLSYAVLIFNTFFVLILQAAVCCNSSNISSNNRTKTFIFNNTHSTFFACKKCTNFIRAVMCNISYTKTQQNFYKHKPYLAFIMKPCSIKVVQSFEIILCENHVATNALNNCLEDELLFDEAKTNVWYQFWIETVCR